MMADQRKKKSGAANRKRKNEIVEENAVLSKRMLQFLQPSPALVTASHNVASNISMHDDTIDETVSDFSSSHYEQTALSDVEYVMDELLLTIESQLHEFRTPPSSPSPPTSPQPTFFAPVSPDSPDSPNSPDSPDSPDSTIDTPSKDESAPAIVNPRVSIDHANNTFDPSTVIGLSLSEIEKLFLLKMDPCHPPDHVLKVGEKKYGNYFRHCTQNVFYHEIGLKRKWISYSISSNALYCIPCLLFTDELSRGDHLKNQGKAFVDGFSNWKNQNERVKSHEKTTSHKNAKDSAVLFQRRTDIKSILDNLSKVREEERLRDI